MGQFVLSKVIRYHSLLGSSSDEIFGTPKKFANSEAFLSIESQGLFKKIPPWYFPLVIFSNYFFYKAKIGYSCYLGLKSAKIKNWLTIFFGFFWFSMAQTLKNNIPNVISRQKLTVELHKTAQITIRILFLANHLYRTQKVIWKNH